MKKIAGTVFFISIICLTVYAQPDPPPPPEGVPLDPLSWMLLAAGGGIAMRKMLKAQKKDL